MRQANVVAHQAIQPLLPGQDRSRKQDFIDPAVLAECVKKIGTLGAGRGGDERGWTADALLMDVVQLPRSNCAHSNPIRSR